MASHFVFVFLILVDLVTVGEAMSVARTPESVDPAPTSQGQIENQAFPMFTNNGESEEEYLDDDMEERWAHLGDIREARSASRLTVRDGYGRPVRPPPLSDELRETARRNLEKLKERILRAREPQQAPSSSRNPHSFFPSESGDHQTTTQVNL